MPRLPARRLIRLAATLLCLWSGAAVPAHAQSPIELSIEDTRQLIIVLLNDGQPTGAALLANALLERDPNDVQALVALARAERALGRPGPAVAYGRAAYAAAQTDRERFYAALVTAQALSGDGKRTQAQFWLRRASHFAPDETSRAIAIRDLNYVRSRNPLSFGLDLGVHPTNNVNGGPTTNSVTFAGITFTNPTARPISGLELKFGGHVDYRLPSSDRFQSRVRLDYAGQRVVLGAEAAEINPDLRGSDLATDLVSLSWQGLWAGAPDGSEVWGLDLGLSRGFAAGVPVQDGWRIVASRRFQPFAGPDLVQLRLGYEDRTRLDRPIQSSTIRSVTLSWAHPLENGRQIDLGLEYADTDSASEAVAHRAAGATLGYRFGEVMPQVGLSGELGLRRSVFDSPLYSPEVRSDLELRAGVTLDLVALDYWGFHPQVTIQHRRNRSNVSVFDTSAFEVGLVVVSSF